MMKGHELFKKPNQETEFTPEQLQELKKCASDPVHFIKNYIKVQHPKKGSIPFDLYPFQEKMVDAFQNKRFNINLLPRQSGKCVSENTSINTFRKPKTKFKKFLLKVFYRKTYEELYKDV